MSDYRKWGVDRKPEEIVYNGTADTCSEFNYYVLRIWKDVPTRAYCIVWVQTGNNVITYFVRKEKGKEKIRNQKKAN